MKTFLKDFKAFIARGNVIDLAVGVVIGGAFGLIVSSFVEDLLMPLFSLLTGRIDLTQWFIALDGHTYASLQAAEEAGAPVLRLGKFLNAVLQFLLIALALFVLIRYMVKLRAQAETLAQKTAALITVQRKTPDQPDRASRDRADSNEVQESLLQDNGAQGDGTQEDLPQVGTQEKLLHKHRKSFHDSLCPYCFEPVHPLATRCPHCTSALKSSDT